MALFDFLRPQQSQQTPAERQAAAARQADILTAIARNRVPASASARLTGARDGRVPWIATMTPAELSVARSHGLRPVATVSATCWMHYGWSWTLGHSEGWAKALQRLKMEAVEAGANAVLDVKMRTVPLEVENSLDFTLVGTAVKLDGLPPSPDPIVATVPALEFVKLLEADVVPTGLAVGAYYAWQRNFWGKGSQPIWANQENTQLSQIWEQVRQRAHADLRRNAQPQGNGVLAHVNFSQMFEAELNDQPHFLARHIVVATTVDSRRGVPIPHPIKMVVDMHAGETPLTGNRPHHQSYGANDEEGPI